MSNTSTISYLITGANRGVGLALVQDLLEHKPSAVIFAGVRKIESLKAGDKLKDLADKHGDRLNLVQLSSTSVEDAREVGKVILDKAGKLDVVIANAGIMTGHSPILSVPLEDMRNHFEVNTLGPLILFQGTAQALFKSPAPKFAVISSGGASLGQLFDQPITAYATSKVGVNMIAARINQEHEKENLAAFALHPGVVETDMSAGHEFSPDFKIITPQESAQSILRYVDGATRSSAGGKFWSAPDDAEIPW